MSNLILGKFALENLYCSTLPRVIVGAEFDVRKKEGTSFQVDQ